jgi:hypothetical protein
MYAEKLETVIDKNASYMDEQAKVVMFIKRMYSNIYKKNQNMPLINTFINIVTNTIIIKKVLKKKD